MLRRIQVSIALAFAALLGSTASAADGKSKTPPPTRAATAAEVAVLTEVLQKTADDFRRWAYTEHRVMRDHKGKVKSEEILRYDPSLPYRDQWLPLKINGKEPTDRDRAKYRRRGEDAAPRDAAMAVGPNPDNRRRRSLGELIDPTKALVASETATHWVFEIPLLKFGNERFPPEKFQVRARIRKEGRRLENISVNLRESIRSKLVLKVKSGDATLDFAVVDPKYPATLTSISGDAEASVLFVNVGGSMTLKRTELRHVRPFDERFEVQIGTLKAIDF